MAFRKSSIQTLEGQGGQGFSPDVNVFATFKGDFKALMLGARGQAGGRTGHMIKYDYSSIVPAGYSQSSADLWNVVTMLGNTSGYYIPTAEGNIVHRNLDYFANLFVDESPTMIDLGPGGSYAVELKSARTLKAARAGTYVSLDINGEFAINAAELVKRLVPGIEAKVIHGDFTKPQKLGLSGPALMTMYGCTLTQFPRHRSISQDETSLVELLENLGDMIDYNGFLVATIDTNKHGPSARDCYTGQHFDQFKRNFWRTAQHIIGMDSNNRLIIDGNVDPAEAFVYDPRYEDSGIVHSFVSKRTIIAQIDGENLSTAPGSLFDTGFSEKWDVEDIERPIKKTGWKIVNELDDGKNTVRAVVLAGRNTPPDIVVRAKSAAAAGRIKPEMAVQTRAGLSMEQLPASVRASKKERVDTARRPAELVI